jgi:hypothetical protein
MPPHSIECWDDPDGRRLERLARSTWRVPLISLYKALRDHGTRIEYADAAHILSVLTDADYFSEPGFILVMHKVLERGEIRKGRPRKLILLNPSSPSGTLVRGLFEAFGTSLKFVRSHRSSRYPAFVANSVAVMPGEVSFAP